MDAAENLGSGLECVPMVRREADGERQYELPYASCTSPAGESPVPVSAGAPGSRPQALEGDTARWTREYSEALGLHRLRGTIRYPGTPFWDTA